MLSTSQPTEILASIDSQYSNLYLLDIELGQAMDGFELASEIRKLDVNGKIVFVTTHAEMAMLTFKYQLEVLDYVLKDDPTGLQARLIAALKSAMARFQQAELTDDQHFQIKVGDQIQSFLVKDTLFIESATVPHKLILHTLNTRLEFYGTIRAVTQFAPSFYKCHKSIVVNIDNVRTVSKRTRKIELIDGETIWGSIAGVRELLKAFPRN